MSENSKESAQLAEIEKQHMLQPFTHGRPWDKSQNIREIQQWNVMDEHCIFQLGCRLIEAKNNIESGQWLAHLKEGGIDRRKAARYIRVAMRLGDKPRLRQLKAGIAKLDIFAAADEEDLEDFERSGTFLGKDRDELDAMSREELKNLVRKNERRIEQAKEQLSDRQAEVERLERSKGVKDQFFEKLTALRRTLYLDIGEFKRAVMGDTQKEIALYNVLQMIQRICAHEMLIMENESNIDTRLCGTIRGWDPLALELINLMEYSKEQAEDVEAIKQGHPVPLRHDPEEKD